MDTVVRKIGGNESARGEEEREAGHGVRIGGEPICRQQPDMCREGEQRGRIIGIVVKEVDEND